MEIIMVLVIVKCARNLWLTVKPVLRLHDPQRAALGEFYLHYLAKEEKSGRKPLLFGEYYPVFRRKCVRKLIAALVLFAVLEVLAVIFVYSRFFA